MYPITTEQIEEALLNQGRMRTGRSIGRTLYLQINAKEEVCVGILDSPYLAEKLATLWNEKVGR